MIEDITFSSSPVILEIPVETQTSRVGGVSFDSFEFEDTSTSFVIEINSN